MEMQQQGIVLQHITENRREPYNAKDRDYETMAKRVGKSREGLKGRALATGLIDDNECHALFRIECLYEKMIDSDVKATSLEAQVDNGGTRCDNATERKRNRKEEARTQLDVFMKTLSPQLARGAAYIISDRGAQYKQLSIIVHDDVYCSRYHSKKGKKVFVKIAQAAINYYECG